MRSGIVILESDIVHDLKKTCQAGTEGVLIRIVRKAVAHQGKVVPRVNY
jgi:hypothetical protein